MHGVTSSAHVFLVPGFFGFANVGSPRYFQHVRAHLDAWSAPRGLELHHHDVRTHPTASLRTRLDRLRTAVHAEASGDELPIHLIGHSTGALDGRQLLAPSGGLDPAIRARVQSLVSIAGPHRGTPAAGFFASLRGHHVLRLLSMAAVRVIRWGALEASLLRKLSNMLTQNAPVLLLDRVYRDIVDDLEGGHRDELDAFFSDVANDGSLLVQLAPECMVVVDALLPPPADVRCGSVVAAVPARDVVRPKGTDPRFRASLALFGELHRITASTPHVPWPELEPQQAAALEAAGADLLHERANDGLVPARSQVWQEVIAAVRADHMDLLGHFADLDAESPHQDWMYSGADFSHDDFERLWDAVAQFAFGGQRLE